MRILAWNDYLKTGIEIIDQQHRGLIDLVNETAAKLSSGEVLGVDEMRPILGFLTDYTATHFSTEEALMALGGVPDKHVSHHRQSHASFLQQVNAMVDELSGSGPLSTQHLMDFLGNWLIYHILGEDQYLSRLLRMESGGLPSEQPARDLAESMLAFPAQEAANKSLAKLYTFMASRNAQSTSGERPHGQNAQLSALVAKRSAELAASEERFRELFQDGALPIVISRLEKNLMPGAIIAVNTAVGNLLAYSPTELVGRSLVEIVAPEEIARFPLLIKELLVTGKFECEMTHITQHGKPLTTQVSMTLFVQDGHPVTLSVIQDISARRASELAQAGVQQQAAHLAEIRSDYLAATLNPAGNPGAAYETAVEAGNGMGRAQIAAFIGEHVLFKDLPEADQTRLANACRLRRLENGELLFRKGDRPAGIHLVISGHIALAVTSPQGGKKVLGIYGLRQSIGEAEVVMDSPYPYFGEAIDDTEVIEIGKSALLAILDRDNRFARRLMNRMGSRQHDLVQDVESYTLRSGAERVIGYLLQHATIQVGGPYKIRLPATKQTIASLLHIKPETLSRIFRDLSEAGLIQVKGRNVQVPDIDQLIAYQAVEAVKRT